MTVDMSLTKLAYLLGDLEGSIGIEGEGVDTEMVVRLPMSPEAAANMYSALVGVRS